MAGAPPGLKPRPPHRPPREPPSHPLPQLRTGRLARRRWNARTPKRAGRRATGPFRRLTRERYSGRELRQRVLDAALLVGGVVLVKDALGGGLVDARGEEGGRLLGLVRLLLRDLVLETLEQRLEARLGVSVAQPLLGGQADTLLLLLDVGHVIPSIQVKS